MYQEQRKVSKISLAVSTQLRKPILLGKTIPMTEQEYWATDPSFSDEALHALAERRRLPVRGISTHTQPRYSD